jgi:hypothetical protein
MALVARTEVVDLGWKSVVPGQRHLIVVVAAGVEWESAFPQMGDSCIYF